MSKIINFSCKSLQTYCKFRHFHQKIFKRTFLSNAYYCKDVWNERLKTPLLQKIDVNELYVELENNYNKKKNISAVDVDIFANALKENDHVDELLDLIYKLRLSAETTNTLPSTEHAVIRFLNEYEHYDRLIQVLDDRLNYGIFLDNYTASLLLDTFWKKTDYTHGVQIATQMMLQEEFSHPFVTVLSLLHCFKFLQNPVNWSEPEPQQEPEEEIKVRVKYLRNPYFDGHFDLKKPMHLVGKTIIMSNAHLENNPLSVSFKLIGLTLQEQTDKAKEYLTSIKNIPLISNIINLLPEDNEIRVEASKLKLETINVQEILEKKAKEAEEICSEKDIYEQCKLYENWINVRQEVLEKQLKRLDIAQRLETITDKQQKLREKEKLLWYFDNEEKIELEIEDKKVYYPKRWFGKKKKPRQVDESYVPPELQKFYKQ